MTFGASRTVEEFLKSAARKRKFDVIVAESAPSFRGQELALTLSKAGIETTLIPDSAIFAMMARVNKVIVSTHAVMANGGLIALTGTHMVALAAKHHSVPFVVCTGLYKLCPVYPYSQETINDLKSPSAVLNFEESTWSFFGGCNLCAAETTESVHVHNPTYDYIPPELISLYITNLYVFHAHVTIVAEVTIQPTFTDYWQSTITLKTTPSRTTLPTHHFIN